MKINLKKILIFLILSIAINQAYAQFILKKSTINSGGGKLTGGSFELQGSIAQVDASDALEQGDFSLNGGFWHQNTDFIFKNDFEQ